MRFLSRFMFIALTAYLSVGFASLALSQTPKKSVAVTIYSNTNDYYGYGGYSVVREVRSIDLQPGQNEIRFSDVAQLIDATSVHFKSLLDPNGTYVLEQNFEYDLVSADKLLSRYIDQEITLYDERGGTIVGTLLSFDHAQVVLSTNDPNNPVQIITRADFVQKMGFPQVPGGLITKPTLMWLVLAQQGGTHDIEVAYQTAGMGWLADYTMVLADDDRAMDLSSWVTISNNSGATYEDANLKLVAGDVNRVQTTVQTVRGGYGKGNGGLEEDGRGFEEKSFFEYHLYTLGRTTTVQNASTKQIELFEPASHVPLQKVYVYDGSQAPYYGYYGSPYTDTYYGTPNQKVDIFMEFQNEEKVGLGVPLPAGRVRVYKHDRDDGSLEFIGEDRIDHTPKDEQVRLKLGSAFDVVGEWKQSDFKVDWDAKWMEESFEITLRNHKPEPVEVVVLEHLYRWSNWQLLSKSHDYEQQDAQTITFDVEVPKEGETKLTYTVKYSW